ncbi:AraC family transcriptional regulator [Acinetobacter qingfengensis]|uniref:Transcriptional regulator n=1 Tax=Acinetobacter qingfengensis TaxID=1262585 RepID=A0A1E7R5E5_9GAMM|nr:AraC family transcriptional regulator [Acinetobacter qingfengensis]KAA8730915.1 AraC family transcriptional regulator [Acinetobacter qingfengensis]OEY94487.1 transcriptional regulator [Acinetobacter qingfengensis]
MSYDCDDLFIPAHQQLSLLIDLANQYQISQHILFKGSGLFLEDVLSAQKLISPQQFKCVLHNAQQHFPGQDIQFLFGSRSLVTPFNAAITSILYAHNLKEVFHRYVEFSALVSPWLTPRIMQTPHDMMIYWLDGNHHDNRFLIEVSMAAIHALCRQLFSHKLEWQYEFNFAEPEYIEQYWTHLGSALSFERPMNCMRLDIKWLDIQLPHHTSTLSQLTYQQAQQQIHQAKLQQSFLEHLYSYLMQNIQQPIQLESTAQYFQVSPATLKRRLKKHDTHFQAQVDQCRLHTAMLLHHVHGFKTEQIANYLSIHDPTNFRRAFKRWCGWSLQSV